MLDTDFVQRGRQIYNTTLEYKVFESLYQAYDMAWSVHPLLSNCILAPDTAVDTVLARFDDQYDIKVIITNIVHNVAFATDTVLDVRGFFMSTERGQAFEGPYEAGFGIGRLVYYLIADNELAKQVDPAEGMDLPTFDFSGSSSDNGEEGGEAEGEDASEEVA